MPRYKNVDGIQIEMTAAEITAFEALQEPPKSSFDRAMEDLRVKRNAKLAETDWIVLADSPVADNTAWQTYRTELRDLTNGLTTVEQVDAVTWPTKPGA
jgi:hypothetical protein